MVQTTGVPDEEGANAPLNFKLLLKQKMRLRNCNTREICRDVVGRKHFF